MGLDPFIGSIRAVGFNFAEQGWLLCDGRTYQIAQYQALFAVIGFTYGGNGSTLFAVPDLRGRAVAGDNPSNQNPFGILINQGMMLGSEQITLLTSQMPAHNHIINRKGPVNAIDKTNTVSPMSSLGSIAGIAPDNSIVVIPSSDNETPPNPPLVLDTQFSPLAVSSAGGNQPHENRQPLVAVNFQIAFDGIFPSRP